MINVAARSSPEADGVVEPQRTPGDRRRMSEVLQGQEEERRRIARDIHDDTLQVMAAVALRLGSLRRSITDDATVERVGGMEIDVRNAIARLRRMIGELRPALAASGLAAALRGQLDDFADCGLTTSFIDEMETDPDNDSALIVLRVAEDAFRNVRQHAHATRINIIIRGDASGLSLRISDDGEGFDPAAALADSRCIGLAVMRRRTEMAGGWFHVDSGINRGTAIELFVPAGPLATGGPA